MRIRLTFNVFSATLEAIWALGDQRQAIGYWIKADRKHYLLLDVSKPVDIRMAGSGQPSLWDCRVLSPPVQVPLSPSGETFAGHIEGPFALITGLNKDAHPAKAPAGQDRR